MAHSLIFTQVITPHPPAQINFQLPLTAEERQKSRQRLEYEEQIIQFRLPRGTILKQGDYVQSEEPPVILEIIAKAEPVLTVTASSPLELMKASYHLGNRHIPLEIRSNYLRLSPDPVLASMLEQMGLTLIEEVTPFEPEIGAYH